mgnify:CR=1 FL=1
MSLRSGYNTEPGWKTFRSQENLSYQMSVISVPKGYRIYSLLLGKNQNTMYSGFSLPLCTAVELFSESEDFSMRMRVFCVSRSSLISPSMGVPQSKTRFPFPYPESLMDAWILRRSITWKRLIQERPLLMAVFASLDNSINRRLIPESSLESEESPELTSIIAPPGASDIILLV